MTNHPRLRSGFFALVVAGAPLFALAGDEAGRSHIVVIENRASGGVLEISPDAIGKNGTRVTQNGAVPGRTCQQWILTLIEGKDIYRIESRASSNQVLDADHWSINKVGTFIQTWNRNETCSQHQKWQLVPLENGFYKIINVESQRVLDLDANRVLEKDASVSLWDWNGGAWQQWRLITR